MLDPADLCRADLSRPQVGFSMGTNVLVKFVGEVGPDPNKNPLTGAVSVCNGYDIVEGEPPATADQIGGSGYHMLTCRVGAVGRAPWLTQHAPTAQALPAAPLCPRHAPSGVQPRAGGPRHHRLATQAAAAQAARGARHLRRTRRAGELAAGQGVAP